MTIRTSEEIREDFKLTYEVSGSTSQNDFLGKLLHKWNNPEKVNTLAIEPGTIETPLILSPEETQEIFKTSFEASEANSMDEFLGNLLKNFNNPEEVEESKQIIETSQPPLQPNEIFLSLTPAQIYAIRETVLSKGFTQEQNEIIEDRRILEFYCGKYQDPEFKSLFIKNIVLTEDMTADEKETAIRHNMAALPINLFLFRLIQGNLQNTTKVTAKSLKSFIREHAEEVYCQFSVIPDESNEMILSLTPAQIYAIRETVQVEGFAEEQNEIVDSLVPENRPFFFAGNLFEPEFQLLWIRNIVLTEDMTPDERETAVHHNMSAFLINMFLMHLIKGTISKTVVTAETLKSFIQEQAEQIIITDAINQ